MSKAALQTIQLQEILEHAPDGMFTIDLDMVIQYANPAFCKLLGYSIDEVIGTSITNHLGDLNILGSCMSFVESCGHCNDQETIFKRKDGSAVHISKNVQALYNRAGNIYNILVSIRDMSALHQLNKELLESKLDSLTNLPNRTKLISEVNASGGPMAILLLNIDSFKELNSFYGHDIADQLLIALSHELSAYLKPLKGVSLYKFPVDEFAILFKGEYTEITIEQHTISLSHLLNSRIFTIGGHDISISITIGAATSSGSRNYLVENANMALKDAKKRRKSYQLYNPDLQVEENYKKNLSWIKRLRSAISENRVVAYYQPIMDAQTKKIDKYEALVRIIEDGNIISPIEFLDISKKVKLYPQITMIMLDKVLETLVVHPSIRCSINLSIEDISDPTMSSYIIGKIKNSSCSERVILEILESEGIDNYDTVNQFIAAVKQYGVTVAIDDFGAGYSNFVYITKLDIDYIKIDGSIIRNIDTLATSHIITKTIIDFASQLNIDTVAEFVSSKNIYNHVKALGITHVQGYYIGMPSATIE